MLVNAIMVVDGRQGALVGFGLIGLAATALAFAASLPFGERWTTLSYAATLFGVVFGGTAFARQSGIGFATQIRAGLTPILLAVTMWGAVTLLRTGPLAGLPPALRLGAEVVAGVGIFLVLALVIDRPGLARLQRLALRR